MPRSPTVLTPPPGTLPFVPNTTIESGKANAVWFDLYQDGNTPRPIEYGGTGASNAPDALNNLGGVGQDNFLSAYSIGDFFETVRDIAAVDGIWLRRNGALYSRATYPELGNLLPTLPDGVLWEIRTSGTTTQARDVTQIGPGHFVAAAGSSIISSIDNGATWTLRATFPDLSIYGITEGNGIYVAVDLAEGRSVVSNDGDTWSESTIINPTGVTSVSYSEIYNRFVAVGSDGYVGSSDDGVAWTSRTSGTAQLLLRVRWVNDIYIAVGVNGTIITSSDGITWTSRASGVSSSLRDACYAQGLYVVAGSNGVILTSPNLTGWTPRTSGVATNLIGVSGSDAGFIAVGDGGVARISGTGTSWTAAPTGTTSALNAVLTDTEDDRHYIAVGPSQTVFDGLRTSPTQFRVPNDNALYGWIKADND